LIAGLVFLNGTIQDHSPLSILQPVDRKVAGSEIKYFPLVNSFAAPTSDDNRQITRKLDEMVTAFCYLPASVSWAEGGQQFSLPGKSAVCLALLVFL